MLPDFEIKPQPIPQCFDIPAKCMLPDFEIKPQQTM